MWSDALVGSSQFHTVVGWLPVMALLCDVVCGKTCFGMECNLGGFSVGIYGAVVVHKKSFWIAPYQIKEVCSITSFL